MAQGKRIASAKSGFTAEKKDKFWVFTCDCGSEMWNNVYKKNSAKSPDLRCKNENCSKGSKGNPNAVWLNETQREALGIKAKSEASESENTSVAKNTSVTKETSYNKGYKDFSNGVPLSMYAAWAKDVAVCLANATKVQSHDEFDALYRTCLQNMEATIKWFEGKVSKSSTPEDQQVKNLDAEESMDIDEPEDIDEKSIDDIDTDEPKEKVVEEEDEFAGLDDLDI